ncbi:hypothetical protein Y032_0124g1193 [Ancylostoma ceylanicum]|uniref:Peptidase A2 domain-containing protein n=1 Tax=Ancylostoma ceylanicum TaxID=53326 RepID=A0A016T977_9BILA|nr:hypothetical protein Y032_0124g1193 [Ancylostoma ceylanicum]
MCAETVSESNICPPKTTNRQVVLMTAEGSIWNAKRRQFERVLFLFDSGAQKTVVEEELAEQFGLSKKTTKMCTVSGGGEHTETFQSHTVQLSIGTAFGEDIEMTVETRPIITSGIPSVKLDKVDAAFLKAGDIYLANTKIRGERQIPRVLVGLDYYHDLVIDHITKTPSGLHIIKTVFGHTICGSGLTEVTQAESVDYNLTAVWKNTEYHAPQKGSELDGQRERQRNKNLSQYSGEMFHAYGFTPTSLSLKEAATSVANNCSVAARRLQSQQLQPSAVKQSRHRPVVHVKPPSKPSSRRSPPSSSRHRLPRHQAALCHCPRQEVRPRHTSMKKKAKTSDINYDYSCRPPEYHRQIDDPCSIFIHR